MGYFIAYLAGILTVVGGYFAVRVYSWAVDQNKGWDCEVPECEFAMGGEEDEDRYNIDSWVRYQIHQHVISKKAWHVEAQENIQ